MKCRRLKVKNNELLFFFSYSIFCCSYILGQSFWLKYLDDLFFNTTVVLITFILFLKEILYGKINIKIGTFFLVIACIFCLSMRTGSSFSQRSLIAMFILIYSAHDIDFDKIAIFSVKIDTVLLLAIIISSQLGFIENYIFISELGRIREYLGFRYALYPSSILLNITFLILYLTREKKQWKIWLSLFVINTICYTKTDGRIVYMISILAILSFMLIAFHKDIFNLKIFQILAILFWPAMLFFSIYFVGAYNAKDNWMRVLNYNLGGRISYARIALVKYGVAILPRNIQFIGAGLDGHGRQAVGTYSYVDNLYMLFLIRYGIIFTILFIGMICFFISQCLKNGRKELVYIFVLIGIHCLIDDLSIYLYYNTFWLSLSMILKQCPSHIKSVNQNLADLKF